MNSDLGLLLAAVRGTEESVVTRGQILGLVGYLMLSAACAAPLAMPDVSLWTRIALASVLLVGFLVIARYTTVRVQSLDEFEQIIAYRSLATAGFVAVWFVLALGVAALAIGFDNLFLIMALGPPQFWFTAALFIRTTEAAYARARDAD